MGVMNSLKKIWQYTPWLAPVIGTTGVTLFVEITQTSAPDVIEIQRTPASLEVLPAPEKFPSYREQVWKPLGANFDSSSGSSSSSFPSSQEPDSSDAASDSSGRNPSFEEPFTTSQRPPRNDF